MTKYKMTYKIQLCSFILFIIAIAVPIHAQLANKNEENNKQILLLLQQSKCNQAESIAKEVESRDKYLSYLPEWYYQTIACHKKNHAGWGDLDLRIDEFFNRVLDRAINNQSCGEAERYINTIDKKFFASWLFAPGLYKIAQCYENTDAKKSVALYRRILADYPQGEYATGTQQRLQFLTGDRSWIFPSASSVIEGVKAGILYKDVNRLSKYASKSNFEISIEEEWMPEPFEEKGKAILKSAFDRSEPKIVYVNSAPNRSMMLVVFSEEDLPFWCFTFDEKESGWQWTGVLISNWQKKYISSDDYMSYKEKVCVP